MGSSLYARKQTVINEVAAYQHSDVQIIQF